MNDNVTVKNLRAKVDHYLDVRQQIKDLETQASDLNKTLQPVIQELTEIMEAMDIDRFEGSKGKITKVKIDYVLNPATDEQKEAFNQYLKDKGIFDEMVSVHHQRLNSFYKSELEQAIEEGRELSIPGLEPKQRIEIRKGR